MNNVYFEYIELWRNVVWKILLSSFIFIIVFPVYFLYIEKWLHHGVQRKASSAFLNPSILALCFIFIPYFSVRPSHLVFYWTKTEAYFLPNFSVSCRARQSVFITTQPAITEAETTRGLKYLQRKAACLWDFPYFLLFGGKVRVETNVGWGVTTPENSSAPACYWNHKYIVTHILINRAY